MAFFSKKSDKTTKMKTLKVDLAPAAKSSARKPAKPTKKAAKPMSFTQWVEHYAKMSGGNPV